MSACTQCQMLSINGLACHEAGCPNDKRYGCACCQTPLHEREIYQANDWDGIDYCRDCAERVAAEEADGDADAAATREERRRD